jgi:hypothetical protein
VNNPSTDKPAETAKAPETGKPQKGKKPPKGEASKKPEEPKESKVHKLSQHGRKLYTPPKRERTGRDPLTVEQYLRKASYQDKSVCDLIRSLHRNKTQSFAEWEREVSTLLRKQTR